MARYVPLFTTLAWIVLISALLIIFRRPLARLISVLEDRIGRGASVKFGGFELGPIVTETADLLKQQPIEVVGNPDQLRLLFKVQGSDWKKSTKALQMPNGCLVQVTTERRNADGSWTSAEALEFVPGVNFVGNGDGLGGTLAASP